MILEQVEQQRLHILLVSLDEIAWSSNAMRGVLHAAGARCDDFDCVRLSQFSDRLAFINPDAVVLLGNFDMAQISYAIEQTNKVRLPIIIIGPTLDPSSVVELLRLGASDYLENQDNPESMSQSLNESFQRLSSRGRVAFAPGHCITLISAVPGTGVSTVASGLAFAKANSIPGEVALAELGVHTPQLALMLDQRPVSTLASLTEHHGLIDSTLVRQAMIRHPRGVDLLLETAGQLTGSGLSPGNVRHILTMLKTFYAWTFLDLSCLRHPANMEALELSDSVIIVCRPDVPCLHLTHRLIEELQTAGVSRSKMAVIFNRVGEPGLLSLGLARETLEVIPFGAISDSPRLVNESRNRGVPLDQIARFSRLKRELHKIAGKLDSLISSS